MSGALSAPFAALPPRQREKALAAVVELPPEIGLLSLRDLAPVIARLKDRHQLNIVGIEVLAATMQLDATVALSARSPRLEGALAAEGCRFASPADPQKDSRFESSAGHRLTSDRRPAVPYDPVSGVQSRSGMLSAS